MHGSFEAVKSSDPSRGVVLRQMAVGQPIGFHSTDGPPLSVIGSQVSSTDGSVSVDFLIEDSEAPAPLNKSHYLTTHLAPILMKQYCSVYDTILSSTYRGRSMSNDSSYSTIMMLYYSKTVRRLSREAESLAPPCWARTLPTRSAAIVACAYSTERDPFSLATMDLL